MLKSWNDREVPRKLGVLLLLVVVYYQSVMMNDDTEKVSAI